MPDLLLSVPVSQLGAQLAPTFNIAWFQVIVGSTVNAWAIADKAAVIAQYAADPNFGGWEILDSADTMRRVLYTTDVNGGGTSVKAYGALGNGAADDTVAIQAAITAVEAAGNGGIVFFPPGNYKITASLRVKKGVRLIGAGTGNAAASASQPNPPATCITYAGASGDASMILVKSGTVSEYVWGFAFKDIGLLGANLAARGLWLRSTRHAQVDAWTERCQIAGVLLDDGNGVLAAFNYFQRLQYQAGTDPLCAASTGLWIRAAVGDGSAGNGCTQTIAETISSTPGATGYALRIGDHDSGWFAKVYGDVLFQAGNQDSQTRPARKNMIGFLNGICNVQAAAAAADGPRNAILTMQSESNSVKIDTALGTYSTIHYTVLDRAAGDYFQTRRYQMSDEHPIPLYGTASVGAPTHVLSGDALLPDAIRFVNAADGQWSISHAPIKKWTQGKITGVRLWHCHATASVGANVALSVNVIPKGVGDSLAAGAVSTKALVVAVADAAHILATTDFIFAAPATYRLNDWICVQVQRTGSSGTDTLGSNWALVGIELLYTCDGPDSDAAPRWDLGLDQLL